MAEIFSGVGTCGVENSATGANWLNRARFMPGIKARDSRCCMYFLPLQTLRCWREWVQVDGRQLVAFKIQILCRDWPAQQNRRESFRCSVLPRGELPLPRIQNFWPPLSDETRRKTHCPIRAFAIQTRETRRPFRLLSHGEEITRSSTVCSSQVSTTQHGSTVRRGPVLHPALASKQNTITLLGVQAGIGPLRLTLDLS